MRTSVVSLGAAVLIAACATPADQPTGLHSRHAAANSSGTPDLDGLPDLIVDEKATANNWLVRVEDLPANFCSVEEGNITPGTRTVIRFTVTTPNVGDADVFVGNPIDHMDPNGDGDTSDQDGMFEFASCHNHFHFQNYAVYRLIERLPDGSDGKVWRAAKRGFCMLDTDPNPTSTYSREQPAGDKNFWSCGTLTSSGFQGVTHGWADTYIWYLGGQYFVLDGGDGQEPVPPGLYYIEVTVNPGYAPARNKPCPLVTDSNGLCHNFAESNYDNNSMRVVVSVPDSKAAHGPLKNAKIYDYEPMKGQ